MVITADEDMIHAATLVRHRTIIIGSETTLPVDHRPDVAIRPVDVTIPGRDHQSNVAITTDLATRDRLAETEAG